MGNKSEFVETLVRAITRNFAGAPPAELARGGEARPCRGLQVSIPILSGHCEVAQRIAERIGLSDEIRENLGQIYERWDGEGTAAGTVGQCGEVSGPLVTLAQDAIALNEAPWLRDHERR